MTEKIHGLDGREVPFTGPTVRRVSPREVHPLRYQIDDEHGHCLAVFDLRGGGMTSALRSRGYEVVGRLVQDAWTDQEWGYSFGLRSVERQRGFRAEILTGPYHAPNGGLSARARFVTIVGDDLPDRLRNSYVSNDAPAVRLTSFPQRALVPAQEAPGGVVGPMSSGAFAHSADAGWSALTGGPGPIPLLDRYETVKQYGHLSR